jgi:hypothetical protein
MTVKILSYLNTNEDLAVDDAHSHAEDAAKKDARLVWLDGDIYDAECDMLDVAEADRLDHNGDISVVYEADEKPSQKQIARALIDYGSGD